MSGASTVPATQSLARLIAVGGVVVFAAHLVWDIYLYGSVYLGNPLEVVLQYIASGALGMSAFEGGLATALLGLAIHLLISIVVAAVFIVAASRVPLVRANPIVAGLLYGLGVLIVMNVVIALSATPKSEPGLDYWISAGASHLLTVGLFLGILVQRSHVGSAEALPA